MAVETYSGQVLTIAQQKGGAGKTTLAAQLAATFAKQGLTVGMIDIDPQGSLTLWSQARKDRLGDDNSIVNSQVQGWRLKAEVDRLRKNVDILIIDSPPHAESEAKIAIRAADLVLVPLQPSPMDLWACKPTFDLAENESTELYVVLNRVDSRTKLTGQMTEKLGQLDVKVTKNALGSRVAFASSMMDGLGVVESEPSSQAAKEITALAKEIRKLVSLGAKAKAA